MKNFTAKEITIFIAVLYFAVIAFLFLSVANKWLNNQDTDIKIKKELHIANLIGQYTNDLNTCLESARVSKQPTEEECVELMNKSNLAKLITSWGYEDALLTIEEIRD